MKQWRLAASCCLVMFTAHSAAWSQDKIYRCGNEYTNSASIAKQRNCQVVEGGHVTVVHTGAAKSSSTQADPSASGNAPTRRSAVQVDPGQQKARDNDAKAILQGELSKAQDKLNALKAEYNNGDPVKTALELRNPQIFNERLETLKSTIARQEADVAGIQRELARHSGG